MKAEELKGKTQDELQKTLMDLKKQQFNLRMQLSQGQLENTSQVQLVRRQIARVKTFIGQQAFGGIVAKAPSKKAPKDMDAAAKPAAKKATAKKAAAKTKKADGEAA